MTILVVDDNVESAYILVEAIRSIGYHTEAIFESKNVMAAVEAKQYELVILDLLMPEPNGLELAKLIRKSQRPDTLILAISGIPSMEDEALRQHLFPAGILIKPFRMDDLKAALTRILGDPPTKDAPHAGL